MENKNKLILFVSSGLSGGITTELVKNTNKILSDMYTILNIQFANDPDYKDVILKEYSKITLEEIYSAFDKVIASHKPKIYIGHSFSGLLSMYYLLERSELLRSAEKIILLDPTDTAVAYPYLMSNTDRIAVDSSITARMKLTTNPELIQCLRDKGVDVLQLEASDYDLDHECKDFKKLKKMYQDLHLL